MMFFQPMESRRSIRKVRVLGLLLTLLPVMTVFVANRFHDAATTAFMNKISLKFSIGGG